MSESHEIRVEPIAPARPAEPIQAAQNVRRHVDPTPPKPAPEPEQTDVAAATAGHLQNAYAQFRIDPDTQEVVVQIRDAATDRIIDELPSREVQAMTRHMKEYADMLARRAAMHQAHGS